MKRRDFIAKVAVGAGSTYAAMVALDLLARPTSAKEKFQLTGNGGGKRIVILGAGLAGMNAAYEMGKIGYNCTILEARSRAGGRCWTVRRGTEETEIGSQRQVAKFDNGLYFNPGPLRIPYHQITLDYCKEFNIPVEIFTNMNRAAYFYNENAGSLSGKRVRNRAVKTDMDGYISELLAKAINQDALDLPITAEDKEKMVEFLRREGDLKPDLFYKGSTRRGYDVPPGAGLNKGKESDPFDLSALIKYGFASSYNLNFDDERYYDPYHFEKELNYQMPMFQIVGGMDGIAKAFESRVGKNIIYSAEVKEIRKTPNGVRIVYADKSGKQQQVTGDYCICTIPLSVLKSIPSDFSPKMKEAIASVNYKPASKIGLQFARRFWEEDDQIFGGISWTNTDITQILYPSDGYLSKKGVVIGYYNFAERAVKVGNMSLADRQAYALKEGSKIHPQYEKEFENSFSIAWHKIKYNLGGWASYTTEVRQKYYPTLNQPDGSIYLAGEHMTYSNAWMAGALESAQKVASQIHSRIQKT